MGNAASAPPCPRCGTPFPVTARFCRSCGLTQEVAQDPVWRASAVVPVPDVQPQGQPYAPAAQQPYAPAEQQFSVAPPGDPFVRSRRGQSYQDYAPLGYADEPPPKRSFWRSLWGVMVMVFLLLMVGGVAAFGIYYYPSLCSVQQRKTLPQDLPLPCGITYLDHLDRSASGTTGPGSEEWVYSVQDQKPDQIISFYQARLIGSQYGWTLPAAIQNVEDHQLAACKGDTVVLITSTDKRYTEDSAHVYEPPDGGSLLLFIRAFLKNLAPQIQQACTLNQG